jgi:hypothetical protein
VEFILSVYYKAANRPPERSLLVGFHGSAGNEIGGLIMKLRNLSAILIVGLSIAISGPVVAHHGNAAYEEKTLTLKGTVTEWKWLNPHSFLKFDVTTEKGEVEHWIAEWNAPSTLINFGITAKSFKPGDQVTVNLRSVSKAGTPVGRVQSVITPDGRELSMGNER